MISILGYATGFFFLLTALNALKKHTKIKAIKTLGSYHREFGMITVLLALSHFILNIVEGNTNLIGFLGLFALMTTGFLGYLFYKLKKKNLYLAHRIMGPIAFLLIIIHILTN
jgi:DMSO/TMAO reductase YedYZ heme-binding membrane subunit